MTAQPTRDQLSKRAGYNLFVLGPDTPTATARETCVLLDQLAAIEADVKRLSWSNGHLADKYAADMEELREELDQAEARIRDLAQEVRDERGAALDQMEQVRIRDARIKAVEDVLDAAEDRGPIGLTFDGTPFPAFVSSDDIRRALEGSATRNAPG